ncbi:sensor histidine kinase [Candidatus Soleaferrea massiliensis]|uniref:sensor histidine kinase n=1 Tax=Candidatus Soleaferrea massiliensis TaxID=1470354 RepID=UPI00058DCEDF|nr:histidine kinase [Candidatus Soleaferrea massiliensis]
MGALIDKFVLLLGSLILVALDAVSVWSVIFALAAISLSALNSCFDRRMFHMVSALAYLVGCLAQPYLLLFLPLVFYDVFFEDLKMLVALSAVPILNGVRVEPAGTVMMLVFLLASLLLKHHTTRLRALQQDYAQLQDEAALTNIRIQRVSQEFLEKQDYEVSLATLRERNRIAREIHDNVGHLLSSSILQIGALMAVNKDERMAENLSLLKDTLSQGMDSIRSSVHDLHDDSADLFTEANGLVSAFTFCEARLKYNIEREPPKKLKHCFLSVLKEALANVIKHSNASRVQVFMDEHPAFYQLVIWDNGTHIRMGGSDGMGVKGMLDRVKALHGVCSIDAEKGFRIFISIPKQEL